MNSSLISFEHNAYRFWNTLEYSWKVILLSNYCFNFNEHITLTIKDIDLECPSYGNNQSDVEYLMDCAKFIYGDNFLFEDYVQEIPKEVLFFICNHLRFLWCSSVKVNSIYPLKFIRNVKEIKTIGIDFIIDNRDLQFLKNNYIHFSTYNDNKIITIC